MLKKWLWCWMGIVFVFGAPNAALADCPDTPVTCGELNFGWRGRCFKAPVSCTPCGPNHCPSPVGERHNVAKVLPKHKDGAKCRQFVHGKKATDMGKSKSACSTFPQAAPKAFWNLTDRVFGKSACFEHDICYAMRGVSRAACDAMFRKNMEANCNQFFFGHLGKRPAIAALNMPGYGVCMAAAKAFYDAVRVGAKEHFNPHTYASSTECSGIPAGSKD